MTPTLERAWPRQSGVRGGPLVVARSYGARHRLAYARLYVEANREKINEKQRISRVRAKKKAAAVISAPNNIKPRWTRAMISRLGKEPDAVIAASFGIGFRAVAYKRRSLGIAGWRKK